MGEEKEKKSDRKGIERLNGELDDFVDNWWRRRKSQIDYSKYVMTDVELRALAKKPIPPATQEGIPDREGRLRIGKKLWRKS